MFHYDVHYVNALPKACAYTKLRFIMWHEFASGYAQDDDD